MSIYNKLEQLSKNAEDEGLVKRYLLDCCEKYVKFRSSGELAKNLIIARKFLNGRVSRKKIHRAEWELEGEAFGVELYLDREANFEFRIDKNIKLDLIKLRIMMRFTNSQSKNFLEKLVRFIDGVFCYIEYTQNGLPSDKYQQFMCPVLFERYFGNGNIRG